MFKRKDPIKLAEDVELELRERITYLEAKVDAQHVLLLSTTELMKFLIEHRGDL